MVIPYSIFIIHYRPVILSGKPKKGQGAVTRRSLPGLLSTYFYLDVKVTKDQDEVLKSGLLNLR